ncbi:MAG: WYL domain-containing protein [Actinobacteria bacterium]|nr:WYL domain-containing protein [Actinomycetota bacterium]MCI0677933.1 WYL domain-containing protein [Actinomycetota bacterium]
MQSVVERVLNLLIYLLESPTPVTADDIRHTVQGYGDQSDEAFHRMFERDKDVLRRLGVPLKRQPLDVWEVDYGYTVDPDEYAVEDPGLTQEERVALSVAARMVRLGGSHIGLDALLKLGGVERGVGLEPIGADLGATATDLGDLFTAVTERRLVEFGYRGQARRLRPYGIAHRRGHWYVVGETGHGERVYRIDRIEDLEVSEERGSFDKPRGFDVRGVLDSLPWESGGGERVEARVRFDPDVAWWAARTLGMPEPEGELVTVLPVVNTDAFIGWVLSFGDSAEILEPETMRREVLRRVEAAMAVP